MIDFTCERCHDTGLIGVRTVYPMSYVGPGPVPDYARDVCEARCMWCDPVMLAREYDDE